MNSEPKFAGFPELDGNFTMTPNLAYEVMPDIAGAEFKCLMYIVRHTYGFHDRAKRITLDEFVSGRKRADGTRLDNGTGLTRKTVQTALTALVEGGYITREVDDSDKGRERHIYGLKFSEIQGRKNYTPEVGKLRPSGVKNTPRTEKQTSERNSRKEIKTQRAKNGAGSATPTPRKSYAEMHPELTPEQLQAQADAYMKLGPGQTPTPPNDEVIAVLSVRTGDFPVYDAVERLIWNTPNLPGVPRNWDGREGGIAKWLTGDIKNWGRKSLGHLPAVATEADVIAFVAWYGTAKPGLSLPRNPHTFAENWREWWPTRSTGATMPERAVTPAPARPVNYAEIQAYREQKAAYDKAKAAGQNPDPLPSAPKPVFE